MWIVKNELSESLPLPELQIEIGCKEYVDLDAHGRSRSEEAASVKAAVARGALRVISKTAPEPDLGSSSSRETALEPAGVLRDLVENPPMASGKALLIPPPMARPGSESEKPAISVKEAFRKLSRAGRRAADAEDAPATPEMAAIRKELERFRLRLLADIERLLDDRLGPL